MPHDFVSVKGNSIMSVNSRTIPPTTTTITWAENQYPISDQNGYKTISFGSAHTYKGNKKENHPPL